MSSILKNPSLGFRSKSFCNLLYSKILFECCCNSQLVHVTLAHIMKPIIGWPFRHVIKHSAFTYFCGGDSLQSCIEISNNLYHHDKVKTILDHSIEEIDLEEAWEINLRTKINLLINISE